MVKRVSYMNNEWINGVMGEDETANQYKDG